MPKFYWAHFPTLINSLRPVVAELGRFPTDNELDARELSGLRHAISRFPGGRQKLAEILKCDTMRKPRNYWTKEITIKKHQRFNDELGRYPKQKDFKKFGRFDLLGAIYKHGNLNNFRAVLKIVRYPHIWISKD